jgi:hypothetical protein
MKYQRKQVFHAVVVVSALLFMDTAAVSFFGRSTMLFIAFALAHFSSNAGDFNSAHCLSWDKVESA